MLKTDSLNVYLEWALESKIRKGSHPSLCVYLPKAAKVTAASWSDFVFTQNGYNEMLWQVALESLRSATMILIFLDQCQPANHAPTSYGKKEVWPCDLSSFIKHLCTHLYRGKTGWSDAKLSFPQHIGTPGGFFASILLSQQPPGYYTI